MRVKRWSAPLGAALVLCGCNDIPMGGRNIPEDEARFAPVGHVVASSAVPAGEAGHPTRDIRLGGQVFVASGSTLEVADRYVQNAGAAAGQVFYALTWDTPPYDRLLAAQPDGRWVEYLPVVGADRAGGGHAPAAEHGTQPAGTPTADHGGATPDTGAPPPDGGGGH